MKFVRVEDAVGCVLCHDMTNAIKLTKKCKRETDGWLNYKASKAVMPGSYIGKTRTTNRRLRQKNL